MAPPAAAWTPPIKPAGLAWSPNSFNPAFVPAAGTPGKAAVDEVA